MKMIDPEVTINKKFHSEDMKITETEVIVDNKSLLFSLDPQIEVLWIEDQDLHIGPLAETMLYI